MIENDLAGLTPQQCEQMGALAHKLFRGAASERELRDIPTDGAFRAVVRKAAEEAAKARLALEEDLAREMDQAMGLQKALNAAGFVRG